MYLFHIFFITTLFKIHHCLDLDQYFENINEDLLKFNQKSAEIAWESLLNPTNEELEENSVELLKGRIKWQHETCYRLATLKNGQLLNRTQARQTYLLCRGPKYSFNEAKSVSKLYSKLQSIYSNAEICIPTDTTIKTDNLTAVESAILNYVKSVGEFLKIDPKNNDSVLISIKILLKDERKVVPSVCLNGEEDFEKLMEFSRNVEVLKWLWLAWRDLVGPPMKEPYRKLVVIENRAAIRNGYSNIGESWRNDIETPNLRVFCRRLYNRIKPLYTLLHGVVRFYLRRYYGDFVSKRGPIPAHLLGNLWSQNWEPLSDLILTNDFSLDENIKKLNWTVMHMAKRAEDFYQSFGLPAMTEMFWKNSIFTRENERTRCHGTAADMFRHGDFRLLYCSNTTKQDFYVLHHEMGHIQYYMTYENMPAIFRQAHSALHESIGDAIMLGVMTPQHLHRLGLINDSLLYQDVQLPSNDDQTTNDKEFDSKNKKVTTVNMNEFGDIDIIMEEEANKHKSTNKFKNHIDKMNKNSEENTNKNKDFHIFNERQIQSYLKDIVSDKDDEFKTTDDILLLKQALNILPQIPFSLLIDEYRWKYFEGSVRNIDLNKGFWQMAEELQGVVPPIKRGEEYFDVGAKYHVPDNTPYIRYFLSKILQYQIFESLCKAAVFGRRGVQDPLPSTIPLHRCDIYGSKTAGKLLKDIMSRGHSQDYQTILQETIGEGISTAALERYFDPLKALLLKVVRRHNIPLGW